MDRGDLPNDEVESLIRTILLPTLPKTQLQQICVLNGIAKTGIKSDLQRRIVMLANEIQRTGDIQRLAELRKSIFNTGGQHSRAAPPSQTLYTLFTPPGPPGQYAMPAPSYTNGYQPSNGFRSSSALGSAGHLGVLFKPSPFYQIIQLIGGHTCDVLTANRSQFSLPVRAQDYVLLQRTSSEPDLRVLVFCADDNKGVQDIAFPHQCELKVNGEEVKANMRGLKNKPGSTRPVDITDFLRLKPQGYRNAVDFTYALTQKKFYLSMFICRTRPVEKLATQIKEGKKITKASVIAELTAKANDPDIETTSQVVSLKCPLTYGRLENPCRGINCSHVQCFDATSYLLLQEQGPQWLCPICNRSAPFEQLALDEYVADILGHVPKSLDQVTIQPDGKWVNQAPPSLRPAAATKFEDDDDELQISEMSFSGSAQSHRTTATPNRSATRVQTPASSVSLESSVAAKSAQNNKRSAPEVIDLTLSDDDELPPAKRPNLGSSCASWSNGSHV